MVMKKCRVCGKEYQSCKNSARNPGKTLRWQEFACSVECGNEYFAQVLASRNADAVVADTSSSVLPTQNIENPDITVAGDFDTEAECLFEDVDTDSLFEDIDAEEFGDD